MGAGAAAAAAAAVLKAHYRDLLRAVAGVLAPACLLFFGGAAAGGILPRHEFQQCMQWVLISYISVSSTLIGKSANKGVERSLGTMAGGLLGYLAALTRSPAVLLLCCALAAAAGELIVARLKLENTGKLLASTYVIVATATLQRGSDMLWLVALTRTGAVLAGVVLCFAVSLACFPNTASAQAYKQLAAAARAAADIGALAWQGLPPLAPAGAAGGVKGGPLAQEVCEQQPEAAPCVEQQPCEPAEAAPPAPAAQQLRTGMPATTLPEAAPPGVAQAAPSPPHAVVSVAADAPPARDHEAEVAACTQRLAEATTKLNDALEVSKAEKLVGRACGRPVYLPRVGAVLRRLNCCGSGGGGGEGPALGTGLPRRQMVCVRASLRGCVHVWWCLHHLLAQQGLDAGALNSVLTRLYGTEMVDTIRDSSLGVMRAAAERLGRLEDAWQGGGGGGGGGGTCCGGAARGGGLAVGSAAAGSGGGGCEMEEHLLRLEAVLDRWTETFLSMDSADPVQQLQAAADAAHVRLPEPLLASPPAGDRWAGARGRLLPNSPGNSVFRLRWHALQMLAHMLLVELKLLAASVEQLEAAVGGADAVAGACAADGLRGSGAAEKPGQGATAGVDGV